MPASTSHVPLGQLKAVRNAKLGREEELGTLRRLDQQARKLEQHASGPSVDELIARESESSHAFGGRSVFGWETPPTSDAAKGEAKASNSKEQAL